MLWELFWTFLKIGFVSFGGGYAMIPLIEREVASHEWMSAQQFADVVAVAGMSPGPIGTNSAIFVGLQTAGLYGAIAAATGMIVPSLLIVVAVATFLYKIKENPWVKYAFYGLRPIITGLIIFAAIRFGMNNGMIATISPTMLMAIGFFAVSLFALLWLRMHPFYVIILSGLVGVVVYT
jgi:chromate transporter